MQKFKINKGLGKSVRFIGLDQEFAFQYFGAVAFTWFLLFAGVKISLSTFILYLTPVFIFYGYFKAKDKKNNILNLKKRRAIQLKPVIFKRDFGRKKEHGKLLNQ